MITDLNFQRVYLMLGFACDFKCRYCLQHDISGTIHKKISDKAVKYIQHLADIRPTPPCKTNPYLNVIFFGGEPLLYFNTIKEAVEKINRENVVYNIISNGNRLTQEVADFCNTNDIEFVLSNDGINTSKIRDRNVLEDSSFIDLFKQINRKSLCAVLSAYNQDLYSLWEYVDNKLGDIHINYDMLTHTWNMPSDIYNYDYEAWNDTLTKLCTNLYEQMQGDSKIIQTREAEFVRRWINNKLKYDVKGFLTPSCGAYRSSVNIDTEGNFWLCHNGVDKFSDCSKRAVSISKEAELKFLNYRNITNKPCIFCEALPYCHGACPLTEYTEAQEMQCRFIRILASYLDQLMKKVDNYFTTDIEL